MGRYWFSIFCRGANGLIVLYCKGNLPIGHYEEKNIQRCKVYLVSQRRYFFGLVEPQANS